ncbi:hypothetical protein SCE1572_24960 [Sorangium cellulosum So0157-2]|uniref:Uncharacterized protein n=2 Tax=Sorangium cellulosum TaxID=56 RepID=S4Y010_SORCE|nr:hypothetical protein SCE1572_24960 [Sorangium cellulosum So0157-2]
MWELAWNGADAVERVALGVLVAMSLAATAVYLWPTRLSGPLLPEEARTGPSSAVTLLAAACSLLTLAACVALALDLRTRHSVVLISRARRAPPDCGRVTWPRDDRRPPDACDLRGIDLGLLVDAVLSSVDASEARSLPTDELVERLQPRLIAAVAQAFDGSEVAISAASHRVHQLPRWLIDSVEIELVRSLADDGRIGVALVAPGGYEGNSLWQAVAELERARGANAVLVDELEIPSGLHVRAIPRATYEPHGTVRAWALVVGALPERTSFHFVVMDGGARIDEQWQSLDQDDSTQRLVKLEWRCAACARTDRDLTLVALRDGAATAEGQLLAASRVHRLRLGLGPDLDQRTSVALGDMLSPPFRHTRVGWHLERELEALGLALPERAPKEGEADVVAHQQGPNLVFAHGDRLAAARAWLDANASPSGRPALLQLSRNSTGPSTTWSYENVTQRARSLGALPAEGAALVATPVPERGSLQAAVPLGIVALRDGWGIASLEPPAAPYSSIDAVPYFRAVAWLAHHAKAVGHIRAAGSEPSAPVGFVRSLRLPRNLLEERRLTHRQGGLALGFYTLMSLSLWRVRRVHRLRDRLS